MKKTLLLLFSAVIVSGCAGDRAKVKIENPLPFDRSAETVEIPITSIAEKLPDFNPSELLITDRKGNEIPSQLIYAGKAEPQSLIFQSDMKAGSSSVYFIENGTPSDYEAKAFGRFVPERMDDYTWENDRIAFRIYGPALIAKDGPSNGLDVWVKRTDRMVIDRWYSDYLAGKNSYHDDNGEGCDSYKVGRTLGAGAMAPFVDDSLWLGINFETWETLDNGPLRTSFRLTYPPFEVRGVMFTETRTFSLDAGSQMNRVTEEFSGLDKVFTVAAGIVKRDEGSALLFPPEKNAIAYRLDGGEGGITYVGTVLTTSATAVQENSEHLMIITRYIPGTPLVYYTGAGWSKWGFETDDAWKDYIDKFSQKLRTPVRVSLK
ncbi:MAG: DUF4861 domain-containing protein [Bacteroidales bacterium]|nr:DUF4861 domain-containing protein [Bacteroidales bacterium]